MEDPKVSIKNFNLNELAKGTGDVEELSPHAKAKFGLAARIINGVFFLFLIAIALIVWGPDSHAAMYEKLFDFIKTAGLSLVTLVIGSYFRGNGEGSE